MKFLISSKSSWKDDLGHGLFKLTPHIPFSFLNEILGGRLMVHDFAFLWSKYNRKRYAS